MFEKKMNKKWLLRLVKEEEVISTLKTFCIKNHIKSGIISGIGAVNFVKIGLYDTYNKEYITKTFSDDLEITSLSGNISLKEDSIHLHLHINLSNKDFQVFGGHLIEAIISATGEIFIEEFDDPIDRKFDQESKLFLLNI